MTKPSRITSRASRQRLATWRHGLASAAIMAGAAALLLAPVGAVKFARLTADLPEITAPDKIATSPLVLDRNGHLLRPFAVGDGIWRLKVEPGKVDAVFTKLLLGYEDRRFFAHGGVDYLAMMRAAFQLVTSGRVVSGASTLTMQTARLIDGRETRSLTAKLRQIALAWALEKHFSKREILKLYLLRAPYGGNLEGIRAATLAYFGKEPGRLTLAEAALLVALPQSPEGRRPDRKPQAARRARDRVLQRMVKAGVVTGDAARAARMSPVPRLRKRFPMFAAHASRRAVAAQPGVLEHRLTIDRRLQRQIEKLGRHPARGHDPALSVAIMVVDHKTGDILAQAGSTGLLDKARHGFFDMTRAVRSPGSTLKPVIYGLAFEMGLAHPASLIEDRPIGFAGYAPENFDGRYRGTVTIREALRRSLNVPATMVLDMVGPARLMSRLKRGGAVPKLPGRAAPGLAIGLGGVGMTLKDLMGVYAAIARGGAPVALRESLVAKPRGDAQSDTPVLAPKAAWYVADILSDTPPPANASAGKFAFKTGTSYGYRDAWSVGFDGAHVVGVWVGRPDGAAVTGLSGIKTAAPIMAEAFSYIALRRAPLAPPPPGILKAASAAALPQPLARFRHPRANVSARQAAPEIAFPRPGTRVDLGLGAPNTAMALAVKIRNGTPPFNWFANGVPVGRSDYARGLRWLPKTPGFVTISVVDVAGRSDRVTVFVE